MVVVILGVIAAVVVPQVGSASQDARFNVLRDSLRSLRSQSELYRVEHEGLAPGVSADGESADEATFIAQMTAATDLSGSAGGDRGPYLRRMPPNPLNGKTTIQVLADDEPDPETGSDRFGWIYRPATGDFWADSSGCDNAGEAFIDY